MIDYLMHSACLDSFMTGAAAGAGPQELRDRMLPAAVADPDSTTLGALLDHLITHAQSDTELTLVRQAGQLWNDALTLYGDLSSTRDEVEASLLDASNPASVARFNAAAAGLVALKTRVSGFQGQVTALHAALDPIPHLRPPHPRQESTSVGSWPLSDRFLARRTAAVLKELIDRSPDDRTTAFATGAVASFVGNASGSAYLGAAVGGPRRLHRVRDRIARNASGAWLLVSRGGPSLTDLAQMVSFGAAPGSEAFPAATRQALEDALAAAYPALAPVSNLDTGLQRMVEHLRLLDGFTMPPLPRPVAAELAVTMTLTAGSPGGGVKPQSYGDDPTDPTGSMTEPTSSDKSSGSGGGCLAILFAVAALLVAALIICIGLLTTEGKCTAERVWEVVTDGGGDDPPTEVTAQSLTAAAGSGAGAELVKEFARSQSTIWQGLSLGHTYLATIGLIYPSADELGTPLFGQFTSTPPGVAGTWPHSEPADEFDSYVYAPSSPVEKPATSSPMPSGMSPADVVDGIPDWTGRLISHLFDEPTNFDLDADRGLLHGCWDVEPGTHISDQPLSVRLLGYDEV